jgi:DNA-binding MarR family transcriptional regulator
MSFGYRKNNQTQIHIPDLMESQLIAYLMDMLDEAKQIGYRGIFLHFDNLELLSQQDLKNCRQLFEDIRDILQLPEITYIFVCQTGFFGQVIAPSQRVGSIMGWPIHVPPLTCKEVLQAVQKRVELLSLKQGSGILPANSSFIERLYYLYNGKIRYVLDSLSKLMKSSTPRTMSDKEAEDLLIKNTTEKTRHISPQERKILMTSLEFEEFTNEDLASTLGIDKTNISKAFKSLQKFNLIYLVRKEGTRIYYKTFEDLKILHGFKDGTKAVRKKSIAAPEFFINPPSKERRMRDLLSYLAGRSQVTRKEYQMLVGIPLHVACQDLSELVESGKVNRVGSGRRTAYILESDGK